MSSLSLDSNDMPLLQEDNSNGHWFDRSLEIHGLEIVVAGAVGGQAAVPDQWAYKVRDTIALLIDSEAVNINLTDQQNLVATLAGDSQTWHAGMPTAQRIAHGSGEDYSPNPLYYPESYEGYDLWLDNHMHNDMIWYQNSSHGDIEHTVDNQINEVLEHLMHTIHVFGVRGAVNGSYQALMGNDEEVETSNLYREQDLYLAMVEAIDNEVFNPDYSDAPDHVLLKEYTYLLNFNMWEFGSEFWDDGEDGLGSLAPEWSDLARNPTAILQTNPLGYNLFQSYFEPVLSRPEPDELRAIYDMTLPSVIDGYTFGASQLINNEVWATESESLAIVIGTDGADQFDISNELTNQQTHASVFVGDGDDTVTDSSGDDFIMFGSGSDTLNTSSGADLIYKAGGGSLTVNSSPDGVWGHGYYAQNVGLSNAIGTENLVSLAGLYKDSDSMIWGHGEIDWIFNADLPSNATQGIALFTDDVFSPSHADINEIVSHFYGQQVEIPDGYRDIYLATPVSGAAVTVNGSDLSDVFDFTSQLDTADEKIEGYDIALFGHGGGDVIWAGGGYASIDGGAGDDIINGGYGDNTLTGGSGSDIFEFTTTSGNDTITDFNKDEDELHFYFREGEAEETAVASINNGVVTWDAVTVDLGDTSLAISDLNITYEMV